jgi:c-di-GMP-specific phosphodiesterase
MTERADIELAREIAEGLKEGAFEPVFQPIARLSDGALAGFEALARWRRKDGTLIGPQSFLDAALAHDLMGQLSRYILHAATAAFGGWRAKAGPAENLFLTVNIPGGDLEKGDIVEQAARAVAAARLPAGALKIEVTEHQILRDPKAAAITAARLREAGVAVALDDFGAGFASLTWLADLPADTLKLDKSLIDGLLGGGRRLTIVRAVIALAHELGLDVVAEGVERADIRDLLVDLGCDYAQGHLFAPALSAGGAEALIHTLASAEPLVKLA